jgi:hypothetical protein
VARPPGPYSARSSDTLAVRVTTRTAQRVREIAGDDLGAWLRQAVDNELKRGGSGGFSGSRDDDGGASEGWRAGWAAANKTFRAALTDALERLGRPA